jgi:quercetin dioxygenase-like cupin family protein
MSYSGVSGQISSVYRAVSDITPLELPSTSVRFVAPGSVTGGEFGLFRWEMKPHAGGPAPHFHRGFSESFYVLGGTVRLYDGERWMEATTGDFLYVPQGGVHAFKNDADLDAEMLILFSPGASRERYFEELAEIAASGRQLDAEERTALYAKHDQFML